MFLLTTTNLPVSSPDKSSAILLQVLEQVRKMWNLEVDWKMWHLEVDWKKWNLEVDWKKWNLEVD